MNTISKNVKAWVSEFNAIPTVAVKALSEHDPDGFRCLTLRDDDLDNYCDFNAYGVPFPMWGTMWTLPFFVNQWAKNNVATIKKCGVDVYSCDLLGGIVLGINGFGYNFLDHIWTPLYMDFCRI